MKNLQPWLILGVFITGFLYQSGYLQGELWPALLFGALILGLSASEERYEEKKENDLIDKIAKKVKEGN